MSVLTMAQEAQLAEEVIATTLQGALHQHGSQKAFAARAGVSSVHVNYIIHKIRMPSLEMAERMAQHLSLPPADRQAWLDHVHAYHQAKASLANVLRVTIKDDFPNLARSVQELRVRAVTTSSPDAARLDYYTAMMLSAQVLQTASPALHPLLYLQTIEVFQEVSAFLGQRVNALWAARRLQWVADELEPHVQREEQGNLHAYRLNGMRIEAVVLNDLHLHAQAYRLTQQLQADPMFKAHFQPWLPVVIWDRMNAMAHIPRASPREAREIWQMGLEFADWYARDWAELCQALLTRSYVEVLISHDRFAEAHRLLDRLYARLDSIPFVGAFHQVLFDQTCARLLWAEPRRDMAKWRRIIAHAHSSAQRAGFTQQLWEMHQRYGEMLQHAITTIN